MVKIQRFRTYDLAAILVLFGLFFFYMLTMPRLSIAKTKARLSNCTGNLKQLGTASVLYASDNNGCLPGPQPWGASHPANSWDRPLACQMGVGGEIYKIPVADLTFMHFRKTLMTFTCPQDWQRGGGRIVPEHPGSLEDGVANGPGICRSYSLNLGTGNLVTGQDDGISRDAREIPVAKIESAAGTAFLVENHGYATVFGQANIANDTTIACTRKGEILPVDAFTNPQVRMHGIPNHSRGNVLMHDGHVELKEQASLANDGVMVLQYLKGDPSASAKPAQGVAR